jgi:hypothetical protein
MGKGFSARLLWCLHGLLLCAAAGITCVALAVPDVGGALRDKYAALGQQLQQNQFNQPLVLASVETPDRLKGDIYARIDHPFEAVRAGLSKPEHWCEVLLLHLNVKYCHPVEGQAGSLLRVNIGKKTPQALAQVPRIEFNFTVVTATADYLDVLLDARTGPLGTSDYRIELEALALAQGQTFVHLTYSYSVNFTSRLALKTYLATIGRNKVGFTVTGHLADGQPAYIGGVRGLLERNTLRYYLAINAFLDASSAEPALQLEQRLQRWFSAVERYPLQLHELDRTEYLEMKRAEHERQQTLQ